jgi:hypothetical protein
MLPMPRDEPPDRAHRLVDGALLSLMAATAFALGCQELSDSDVWWHVRTGQWIRENRSVPSVDLFTYTSADRPWIDLHWLFQATLAAAYSAGGVCGMIVMASAVCTAALLVGVSARGRGWPSWVVAACWLPALVVMSARFVPRPEAFSLLFLAAYLAVLRGANEAPRLAWVLPGVQVLWVNSHGLFVLGPVVLAAYLADAVAGPGPGGIPRDGRWWAHVGGASVLAVAACLVNPYGLRGVMLPLELFPKITAWGGPYKTWIAEFTGLRQFARDLGPAAAGNLYLRTECALFWLLPISFLVPAAWRAGQRSVAAGVGAGRGHVGVWSGALAVAVGLVVVDAAGFPGLGTPGWLVQVGRLAPLGIAAPGALGSAFMIRSSRCAALVSGVGGLATAAWVVWLRFTLLGPEPGPAAWLGASDRGAPVLGGLTAALGVGAAVLTVRAGGRLFGMLLAASFGFLALQASRNMNLFALVAGFVLAGNLGRWVVELTAGPPGSWPSLGTGPLPGLAARGAVAGLLGLWLVAVPTGWFFRATGEPRRFGLRTAPDAYAHDAARFAGRPGLPDRALVFDLRLAGVYVFHNGPRRKAYLDGRLEVPSRETFEAYVRLNRMLNSGRPGWAEAVHRAGTPLILLDHERNFGAEATLLADSGWRCVYYDALGSVFIPRRWRAPGVSYPTVDFAARHFGGARRRAAAPRPEGRAEARALLDLAAAVQARPGAPPRLPLALRGYPGSPGSLVGTH